MPVTSPTDALQHIQDALSQHADPQQFIGQFSPRTSAEALSWARWRPLWDQYQGAFPEQVIGIAAVVSRRALQEFRLTFSADGRVHKQLSDSRPRPTPKPALIFPLELQGQTVQVEYTPDYFPLTSTDYFYFIHPDTPGQAHALCATGYLAQFAPHEAVQACGGPQAYALLFAQERLAGRQKEFTEAFEGTLPEARKVRNKQPVRPVAEDIERTPQARPVVGKHTSKLSADPPSAAEQQPDELTLF